MLSTQKKSYTRQYLLILMLQIQRLNILSSLQHCLYYQTLANPNTAANTILEKHKSHIWSRGHTSPNHYFNHIALPFACPDPSLRAKWSTAVHSEWDSCSRKANSMPNPIFSKPLVHNYNKISCCLSEKQDRRPPTPIQRHI